MAIPIWKDKIVDLGSASVLFRITTGGTTIYEGKATARPGESTAKVRINDICADYLVHALPTMQDLAYTAMTLPTFVVQKKPSSSWTTVTSVQFSPDWSYDYGTTPSDLSAPINGRVDNRMLILFSGSGMSSLSASYHRTSGTSTSRSISVSSGSTGTGAFNAGAVSGVDRITIKSRVYYPIGSCYRYALYYVNAFGGWDQFLIEGNDMEVDEVVRHLREVEYDNNSIINAGKDNYVNEVNKSWTFHSGLLTDDEASRMHHLVDSNYVYLCHIPSRYMYPVIMETNTCQYKTFKNQGRRMVEYTIQVGLAQNRLRR